MPAIGLKHFKTYSLFRFSNNLISERNYPLYQLVLNQKKILIKSARYKLVQILL